MLLLQGITLTSSRIQQLDGIDGFCLQQVLFKATEIFCKSGSLGTMLYPCFFV